MTNLITKITNIANITKGNKNNICYKLQNLTPKIPIKMAKIGKIAKFQFKKKEERGGL